MVNFAKVSLIVAATLVALAIGCAVFVGSGIYNIGADDHHTKIVLAIISELRERSIASRVRAIDVPDLEDPKRIAAGGEHYGALCVACHLAPGATKSDIRAGALPPPAEPSTRRHS
jgi:hypothetical protein